MPPKRHAAGQTAPLWIDDTGGGCDHPPTVPCVVCDTGPCPSCGTTSFWLRSVGSWVHATTEVVCRPSGADR